MRRRRRRISRRWRGNTNLIVGAAILGTIVLIAVFADYLAPYSPIAMNLPLRFGPPQPGHPFGTDEFGRDVLSRVIYGARASLTIAISAVAFAVFVGGIIALATGYLGAWLDALVTRVVDIFLAIPTLLIALGILALTGPSGIAVAIALAIAYTPTFARVIRSSVVSIRNQSYVEASLGMGSSTPRVLAREILPNVLPIVMVQATTGIAWAILDEANLGFIGVGVQPPNPSWGAMLIVGREYFHEAVWVPIAAGFAVLLAVLSVTLLGDGLRDVLDPRSWQRGL